MQNRITALVILLTVDCWAAHLTPSAEEAYALYVAKVEARVAREHAKPEPYLAVGNSETADRNLEVEPVNGGTWPVEGALLHHWRATAFVPNATPKDLLAVLRDFSHFPRHYAPEVVSAQALTDDGETATVAVRFKEQKILTLVLDGQYKVESKLLGNDRGYSASRSLHFWQIDDPGTTHEQRRPEGNDDGFLWRLNSYWSFTRLRGGLLMVCEAVSLTRDVPAGLGWLITPMITDVAREKLEFTMRATRNAMIQKASR
jgi:hypothetical protein